MTLQQQEGFDLLNLEIGQAQRRTGGRILHHWMNGMIAQPEDPYDYCLGCNAQSLYLLLLVGDATPPTTD